MAASDMTATKQRILDAAQEEFGTYGLAGARIDRIAKNAKASKERLYAYFGDKEALFHAVLDAIIVELLQRPISDGRDLPGEDMAGFAVELFDESLRKPQLQRMITWGQLQGEASRIRERADTHGISSRHLASIGRAQSAGLVAAFWDPQELIEAVFGLVFRWVVTPGARDNALCDADELTRRRDVIREAVTRLCRP